MENASQGESEGVLCEEQVEVEDTVEHLGYNTVYHHKTAALLNAKCA